MTNAADEDPLDVPDFLRRSHERSLDPPPIRDVEEIALTEKETRSAAAKRGIDVLTETPEFKAAVAEAVAKATPAIIAATLTEVKKGGMPVPGGADDTTRDFFSQMALAIAEISDQGTNRKRVAPELLAKRAAAAELVQRLVAQARKNGDKPEYRIITKVYLNERLIEPYRRLPDKTVVPQEIMWTGMPNEGMRPLNDVARAIYAAYKESIGSIDRIHTTDNRPLWVTPAGLVVKGDAPQKLVVGNGQPFAEELAVADDGYRDFNDPNATELHILGTIAAPARQNAADPVQRQR